MTKLEGRHTRELKKTVQQLRAFLNRQRLHPRGNVLSDVVVLAITSKAVSVAKAVVCLLEAGLSEEAFGVSRTLVEIALGLRFITNRYTERRSRRFAQYSAKFKLLMMKRLSELKDEKGKIKYTKTELRKMMPDYKLMVKWARKYPRQPSASWSQARNGRASNARTMAMEADGHEKLNGQPVTWQFDYEWIYSWTSQYVHATSVSMESHLTLPREAFVVHIAPYRNNRIGLNAVFNTALYLDKTLRMAFPAIGHSIPTKMVERLESILTEIIGSDVPPGI